VASFFLHQLSLFFPNRKKVLELGSIREQSKIRKAEEKKERNQLRKWATWTHICCQCFLARSGDIKPRTLNDLAGGPVTKWPGYCLNKIRPIFSFLCPRKMVPALGNLIDDGYHYRAIMIQRY
jgi:hypothetical protein